MKCFYVIAPHGLRNKTEQTKMRSLEGHLPPTLGDHTQPPLQLETILGSKSPNTTSTEAAAAILLEGCLGNYPLPENAHCNFCVFFSRLFSTSILIPAHRTAHLGITYSDSFCSQQ